MTFELTHTSRLKSQGKGVVGKGTECVRSLRWEQLSVPGTEGHITKRSVCEKERENGAAPSMQGLEDRLRSLSFIPRKKEPLKTVFGREGSKCAQRIHSTGS